VVKWREVEILVDRMLYEDCFVVGDVVVSGFDGYDNSVGRVYDIIREGFLT